MTEQDNVRLIQELYAAFGRGDVPAILDQLTDDVVWYDPGPTEVPHAGRYSGPEGVGRFFANTGESLDIDEFAPTEFLAQGDRVVVLGSLHARVKATGRSYDNEWAMVWTLRDGKSRVGRSTRTPLASLRPTCSARRPRAHHQLHGRGRDPGDGQRRAQRSAGPSGCRAVGRP